MAKIQGIILGAIALFFSGILFLACKKESGPEPDRAMNATTERLEELPSIFLAFSLPRTPNLLDKRKAVAYAFSKEMGANPDFRAFMYAQLAPNGYRFKEIVIGLFGQKPFKNARVSALINQRLRELPYFSNSLNPLEIVLQEDKLLTLYLPHEFIYSLPENAFTDAIPIAVDDVSSNNIFVAGKCTTYGAPTDLFAFHLSEAKNHKLLDLASGKYEDINMTFSDFHGFNPEECPAVQKHLNAIAEYPYAPGKKLVDPVDDVFLIQGLARGESPALGTGTTFANRASPADYECQRASFQLQARGNYAKNSNQFTGFQLTSMAAFDLIASFPCSAWTSNGTQQFYFHWIYAVDGTIWDTLRSINVLLYSTQLVKYNFKWSLGKYFMKKKYLESGELIPYNFPSPVAVFSDTPAKNHWTPESNGDIVQVRVTLAHPGPCAVKGQTPKVNVFETSSSVRFGIPKLTTDVSGKTVGTVEGTYTESKTTNFQIVASAVYSLGDAAFTYCQPYPSITQASPAGPNTTNNHAPWVVSGSTGVVVLYLNSPWYN